MAWKVTGGCQNLPRFRDQNKARLQNKLTKTRDQKNFGRILKLPNLEIEIETKIIFQSQKSQAQPAVASGDQNLIPFSVRDQPLWPPLETELLWS